MDLSTLANVATALTVLLAVAFGLLETRRARHECAERAAFAAVQAILTPDWMKSMIVVQSMPDESTVSAIEANAEGCILEGLGYSVYARIVPLHVVSDLMGGTVRLAWRKVRPYVEEERRRSGSQIRLNGFIGWPPRAALTRENQSANRRVRSLSRLESMSHHLRFERKSQNVTRWPLI